MTTSDDAMSGDSGDAKGAVVAHADAINARDAQGYIAATAFPFTYQNYNGVALTVESAAAYGNSAPWPWDIIERSDPNWSHSQFDDIETVLVGENSAVFQVKFRRVDATGEISLPYYAIWIAVQKAGAWGVMFRHNVGVVDHET